MKTFFYFLLTTIIVLYFSNPSLEKYKNHIATKPASLISAGLEYITGDHLGISVCREDFYLFSIFYTTPHVTLFGQSMETKYCQVSAFGILGIIKPFSGEDIKKIEEELKRQNKDSIGCPDECINL